MSRGLGILVVALVLATGGALTWACGGAEFDRRLPAGAGGELVADLALGSGFSFDKGSLTVTSHAEDSVRVVAEISGWGEYAVDLDVSEHDGDVRLTGRVEGLLHWAFGGPTVDVIVHVPPGYRVDARIDGGPLLLEDLDGPVTASAEGSEASLRRVVGDVRLEASGDLRVEDVEGAVHLENGNGSIEVRGVRGALAARSEGGGIRVASVAGPVTLTTRGGGIRVERVRGDVRVSTERGRIELEDVEGRVELESQRGGIQVEELAGPVRARSERGAIEVEFVAEPSGVIETGRGSIHVEVPEGSGFALDAQTERGEIDLDGDFLVAQFEAGDERPPTPRLDDPGAAGRALAREVRDQVLDSVRRTLDGDPNAWDWDWRWGLDRDGQGWGAWGHWRSHGQEGRRDREGRWAQWRGRRGESVAGEVNGGGAPLRLHTRHGSIRIEGR